MGSLSGGWGTGDKCPILGAEPEKVKLIIIIVKSNNLEKLINCFPKY